MFDIPGQYINDHCLIYAHDTWHLFFIQGTVSTEPWSRDGNEVIIGHATSPDLINWQLRSPALNTGPAGSLDAGHVYAPNVIERDGTFYMMYTGSAMAFSTGENIFLATSTDLFHWSKYSSDPILLPDRSWAFYYPVGYKGSPGGPMSSRDPHILRDDRYGYICYYVAAIKASPSKPGSDGEYSCIAAATSTDLIHWVDHGPVLTRPTFREDHTYGPPESPCVIKRDGTYYLFWKGKSGTWYVGSKNPLDFQNRTEQFLATTHASELFEWDSEWYITSCSRDIDDIDHSYSDRTRGLFLATVTWNAQRPSVTPLPDVLYVAATMPSHNTISSDSISRRKYTSLDIPSQSDGSVPTASVVDIIGRTIYTATPADFTVDIIGSTQLRIPTGEMAPGIYFLVLGENTAHVKLVIK